MSKDNSKPISFKTIMKNKKLADFVEDNVEAKLDDIDAIDE